MTQESTMLLIAVILMIFLILLAYKTKARIYNLLSIAPMMYLSIAYINSVGIVIMFTGLIFYQIYLTFIN